MLHSDVFTKFYSAFQKRDFEAMQACYHPQATFSDPVFQNLSSSQVKAMWHMLCEQGKDLVIEFTVVGENQVRWEAEYSFFKTGRKVKNIILANFEVKEGLIVSHIDSFDLWKWSQMALGVSGALLGWTPFMKAKIRGMAMAGLNKFIKNHPAYQ